MPASASLPAERHCFTSLFVSVAVRKRQGAPQRDSQGAAAAATQLTAKL